MINLQICRLRGITTSLSIPFVKPISLIPLVLAENVGTFTCHQNFPLQTFFSKAGIENHWQPEQWNTIKRKKNKKHAHKKRTPSPKISAIGSKKSVSLLIFYSHKKKKKATYTSYVVWYAIVKYYGEYFLTSSLFHKTME